MNKFTQLSLFTLLLATVIFSSCKKEYESIQSIDDAAIKSYISKNNLTSMVPDPDKTGFYFQVTNPTDGNLFLNSDSIFYDITVKSMQSGSTYLQSPVNGNLGTYVGYLNGFFQSSLSTSVTYNIPALRTAALALKPGGTARILLPSYLAFGRNGAGPIPSNENLDFTLKSYPYRKQWLFDDVKIQNFLTSKGLVATKDLSRVYYIVNTQGTGDAISGVESTVTMKYTGRLLDGTVFDSSTDGTFSSVLTNLIKGWQLIVPKFNVGSKFRIFVPSDLGYGTSGSGAIPSNAILDFDIEIVSVTN
ncbi:FKBP-type peptidyl-prolyl cis-trans isomerase [Pedobacter kyungheensis]|uniref:FKBP-type peptidyl-prolyl cis-trans isomerase n=1 Tax=Pedobacter kyungheensis TaxID=1069985 RepID=UPI000691FEB6|nr:FKBP-type peptidyl-prolyl cis-trans isomerase [Pedobacter kyungheensis]